ncbi:MAG: c-type cytochrome [Acidimicrobiia bacterium]|nr:c-type cytochrome [Acidimicrobiia bacterium]
MKARAAAMLTLVGTLVVGSLLVLGEGAAAEDAEDFLPAFRIAYPDAAGTRLDTCSLCHFTNSEGKWDENQFADDFDEADKDFVAVQNLDSDGDGYTNLQEIQAGTFPGAGADNPATVVTTTTIAAPPGSGEAIYQANCAGCHGGGGGNLLGRGLTLGQLTTAVANGVTGMPGYTGTLTSSEIILVSQYVLDADGAPAATTTTAPGTPPPPPPDGSALYASKCSACHGSNGGDLVTSTLSHSQLVSATANGTGGGMPPFSGSLTSAEIEAIITFVESIAPPTTTTTAPGTPPPPPPSGAAVYSANCAACHGASGGDLVGRGLTTSQVSAVTKSGTSGMPGFSSKLTTDEITAVSTYVAGLGSATPTTTTTAPGSPPPSGASVWAESCAACHGASGGDLVDHALTDSQLRTVTNNGRGSMPGFSGRLSTEQINAVVAYLSALRGDSSTSSADPGGVDGTSLYAKYCAACHGADGSGGVGGPVAGTSLSRSELISVTADGRDSMPAYSGRMTSDEIAAVADFILGLTGEADESSDTEVGVDTPDEEVEIPDSEQRDDPSDDDGQGLSMFLSDEGGGEGGRSPFIVISMLTVLVAIIGTVGVLWLRSARALAE